MSVHNKIKSLVSIDEDHLDTEMINNIFNEIKTWHKNKIKFKMPGKARPSHLSILQNHCSLEFALIKNLSKYNEKELQYVVDRIELERDFVSKLNSPFIGDISNKGVISLLSVITIIFGVFIANYSLLTSSYIIGYYASATALFIGAMLSIFIITSLSWANFANQSKIYIFLIKQSIKMKKL